MERNASLQEDLNNAIGEILRHREEHPEPEVQSAVQPEVDHVYDDERLVSNFDKVPEPLIKPLYGEEASDLLKEVGIFTEDGKLKPEYGGEEDQEDPVAIEPEVSTQQPEVQEESASTALLAPVNVQPEIQDRPGDYITDSVANLFTKRDPKTGFGNNFPDSPERGDFYMRTDFKPSKLFKWNGSRWLNVSKDSTDVYASNREYIQFLTEQVITGVCSWDDLSYAETEEVQLNIGGRRG
jgi:hypothetical protein